MYYFGFNSRLNCLHSPFEILRSKQNILIGYRKNDTEKTIYYVLLISLFGFSGFAVADTGAVDIAELKQGLDIGEHGMEAYGGFQIFSTM